MKKSKSTLLKNKSIFEQRIKHVQNTLPHPGQAVFFDHPIDLFYLLGLHMSEGKLFIYNEGAHLFVDGRYIQMADTRSPVPVSLTGHDAEADFFLKNHIKKLHFDSKQLTYDDYLKLKSFSQKMESRSSAPLTIVPVPSPLKDLKAVKDIYELDLMRKSAKLLWKSFQHLKKILKTGMSETQAAMEFEQFGRKHGAEKMAFDPIVAFGQNSAMPHYRTGEAKLKKNDVALIDIGVVVEGYHSDMTRVLFFGNGDPFLDKMYGIVKEAQKAALKLCKPGIAVKELDLAARSVMNKHGVEQYFIHSLGHGIGLETHEPPRIKWNGEDKEMILRPGMLITIEPGLYFPGKGGLRYEDTIIINEHSYENLFPQKSLP